VTPSIFDPASTPADAVAGYATLVLAICGAIFALVASLIVVSIVRFRARPGDDGREPPQLYGSQQLELAWTVVPILIVCVLGLVTARTVLVLQKDQRPAGWLEIDAIGHQWWWEFHYPEYGFTTANELHIPLSDATSPRPVFLNLQSQDVIHSFWVPQLSFKTDLIPNRTNHLWIDARKPGVYVGQCAEYCGTQHANMLLRVVVEPVPAFEQWVREQQRPADSDPAVAEGRDLFLATACINCHRVRGTIADGRFGPDLTHLMSRATIAAGASANDRARLATWIESPDHLKPGARMPAMQLPPEQIERLVDYLVTLE
jgi:cytochrome c oxidase subunit 2